MWDAAHSPGSLPPRLASAVRVVQGILLHVDQDKPESARSGVSPHAAMGQCSVRAEEEGREIVKTTSRSHIILPRTEGLDAVQPPVLKER